MTPLETLAGMIAWAGENTAHNLSFIPEERLAWRPAPTAKSALEVAHHAVYFIAGMTEVLRGGAWSEPEIAPFTSGPEASDKLREHTQAYAAALRTLAPERMRESVDLPFGSFTLARAASMPVVDLIHHHGQIAYIQTLLGDEASHFYEESAAS